MGTSPSTTRATPTAIPADTKRCATIAIRSAARRMRPIERSSGFTLLELMVALGIFGLVATTLYGTFARTLRSKGLVERRAEITRVGRAAVNRMADEIGSAYYPTAGRDTGFFRALKSGTEDAPLDSL